MTARTKTWRYADQALRSRRRRTGGLLVAVLLVSACQSPTPDQGRAAEPSVPAEAPTGDGPGSTRFVGPDGDDDAAGTEQDPWETLDFALAQLRAGDTLYVRDGTYEDDVEAELAEGTPARPITVAGYPDESPVVEGLVRFVDPDHWRIRDLEFTWGGGSFDDHMVKVVGGTGWIMDNVRIHGSESRAGLLIAESLEDGPPRDYTLRNSAVYDSSEGANLYLNPGLDSTGGLIERNLFFSSPTENIKVGFGGSCEAQGKDTNGAANVVVRHNTLHDAEQPLTVAEPAERIEVYGNIVTEGSGGAVVRLDGQCDNLAPSISLHDNLGFGADQWCRHADSDLTCEEADDGGNIFPRDPEFDDTDIDGFHPRDEVAQRYGRFAPREP